MPSLNSKIEKKSTYLLIFNGYLKKFRSTICCMKPKNVEHTQNSPKLSHLEITFLITKNIVRYQQAMESYTIDIKEFPAFVRSRGGSCRSKIKQCSWIIIQKCLFCFRGLEMRWVSFREPGGMTRPEFPQTSWMSQRSSPQIYIYRQAASHSFQKSGGAVLLVSEFARAMSVPCSSPSGVG